MADSVVCVSSAAKRIGNFVEGVSAIEEQLRQASVGSDKNFAQTSAAVCFLLTPPSNFSIGQGMCIRKPWT